MVFVSLCSQSAKDALQNHTFGEFPEFSPFDDSCDDRHRGALFRLYYELAVKEGHPRQGLEHPVVCPVVGAVGDHLRIDGEPSFTEEFFLEVLTIPWRV